MDLQDFENWGIQLQEARIENLSSIGAFCLVAVQMKAASTAADLLGQRANWVRRMARVYEAFPGDIRPDVPLSVYEVAAEMPDPRHALLMAVDTEYRAAANGKDDGDGRWSARQLQDWHDGTQGSRVSRVKRLDGEANVLAWEPGIESDGEPSLRVSLAFIGCEDYTTPPEQLVAKAWEVLK